MSSGIDTSVLSTHKVLGSLTQAAILNAQGSLTDMERLSTTIDMVNTTSPSVLILASIDATRRQMALHGEACWIAPSGSRRTRDGDCRRFQGSGFWTPHNWACRILT
jgi:arginine/lysine/ornithine decarboxylase